MEWSTSVNLHRVNGFNEKKEILEKLYVKFHQTQVCDVPSEDDETKMFHIYIMSVSGRTEQPDPVFMKSRYQLGIFRLFSREFTTVQYFLTIGFATLYEFLEYG